MVEPYYIKGVQKQPFADVVEKGVLKNFAKFTGKHLCWSIHGWSHFLMKTLIF